MRGAKGRAATENTQRQTTRLRCAPAAPPPHSPGPILSRRLWRVVYTARVCTRAHSQVGGSVGGGTSFIFPQLFFIVPSTSSPPSFCLFPSFAGAVSFLSFVRALLSHGACAACARRRASERRDRRDGWGRGLACSPRARTAALAPRERHAPGGEGPARAPLAERPWRFFARATRAPPSGLPVHLEMTCAPCRLEKRRVPRDGQREMRGPFREAIRMQKAARVTCRRIGREDCAAVGALPGRHCGRMKRLAWPESKAYAQQQRAARQHAALLTSDLRRRKRQALRLSFLRWASPRGTSLPVFLFSP